MIISFDHNLRRESVDEVKYVETISNQMGWDHKTLKWEKPPTKNILEKARLARYKAISNFCKKHDVHKFIHISALGIENAKNSKYAQSKLNGENAVRKNFKDAIILKPSIVYSVDDNFTTMLMGLFNISPIFPLYYNGKTKFTPLHCTDLTNLIIDLVQDSKGGDTIECIGPEELTFKQIIEKLLKLIEKKRLLLPVPLFVANLMATFFLFFPKPLITKDQLNLLFYDNVPSGKYKTNFDINKNFKLKFEEEVEKYCFMWKETGEYAKKRF